MPSLSTPLQIGPCLIQHRIVLAPMTRLRADDAQTPTPMMAEYYTQRASSIPGTLLITEAVFISASSRGRDINAPGIFTPAQIAQWSTVAQRVHDKGGFLFMQLWHVGRAARPHVLQAQGLEMVSSSAVPISPEHAVPRAMTEEEIWTCVREFADAADNAVVRAGCDGVEIHAANGYLVDQFTQATCNRRTDGWGGDVQRRSRFVVEVVKAVCERVGASRVGVRLAPWNEFQGMGMRDPVPQFTDVIQKLSVLGLAYLHLVEPRVSGNLDREIGERESLSFALAAWKNAAPVILAGGFSPESASERVQRGKEGEEIAIAFGRPFTSNPDLPKRILESLPLTKYDRETFYKVKSEDGYTTWPKYREQEQIVAA